ncbi:hypothetical protein OG784_12865 [Streptomyces sp. NBC_01617]|uniref:hypothetical protein n=1 Tax=Streptomyces sp. NBC_01617 TaxID=2975899 RepID=UPI00386DE569|nr:hypothetical protein OG784_12865 [Streptomyces sp. NBC_01617]
MPTVYMVQADSREVCAAELARMCATFDLQPLLPPTRSAGTERWLARATTKAPAEEGRG